MLNYTGNNIQDSKFIDFDIYGFVGIRLINPSQDDVLSVKKQIGSLHVQSLTREPDIVIQFEKNLHLSNLTYLGLNDAGYTKDGFFLLKSKKANAKVRIPFETIGNHCEIVCETGLKAVPLLIPIINLTLLRKDCIPLHASAFVYKDKGILVTGWAKGGKTEALLAFTDHGAKYVGDEWIILTKDGRQMYGLPEPIRIWDWQIEQLPSIQSHIKFTHSLLFKGVHALGNVHNYLIRGKFRKSLPSKIISEAIPALKRQLNVTLAPDKIFDESLFKLKANFQKLFFVTSHEDSSISVEPWDCKDIAIRMLHSIEYEQIPFFEYYSAFKFAFPEMKNDFLENVKAIQSHLLLSALEKKEAYKVSHPYPVSLQALFHEMEPFCI